MLTIEEMEYEIFNLQGLIISMWRGEGKVMSSAQRFEIMRQYAKEMRVLKDIYQTLKDSCE